MTMESYTLGAIIQESMGRQTPVAAARKLPGIARNGWCPIRSTNFNRVSLSHGRDNGEERTGSLKWRRCQYSL